MSKVWFITGAGSGIGAGIVRAALKAGERVVDDRTQARRHEAAACVRGERGVTQVTGAECAADDVIDVDIADQFAALGVPDQVTTLVVAGSTAEERHVTLIAVRGGYPRMLQRAACSGGRDELLGVRG